VTSRERIERAIHESGHCVVALALGIGVARVSIRGDRDNNGACEVGDTGSLEAKAMVRLAGRAACQLSGLTAARGFGRDEREARALALEAGGDETEAERLLADWRAKTRELLVDRNHWREHGAVAVALLERETVSGSELGSVLYWTRLRSRAA
jgi:hypothetical protein